MGAREKLTIIVDMVADKATTSVRKLDAQLTAAGKTTDGLKGTLNRTGQWLSNNWQGITVAAGAAAVTFGAKAVGAFQTTALEAGKMADATGLAVDEASRWREVASDLGLKSDAVTTALNKMNREAAKGGLKAVGIDAEGTNKQFLAVLDYLNRIPDAANRAKEGTRLLGKGWQELAPLVAKAGELRDRLAEVSDAKVIDEDERRKAEQLRDSLDALKDSGEDLALTLGEELVPATAQLAQALANLADSEAGNELIGFAASLVEAAAGVMSLGVVAEDKSNNLYKFGDTVSGTTRVVYHLNDAMAALQEWNKSGGDIGSAGLERLVNKAGGATQAAEAARQALSYMGASAHLADPPVEELSDSTDDLADSADAAAAATDRLYDATIRLADEQVDLSDAELRFADSVKAIGQARKDAVEQGKTAEEVARAVSDAERDARDAAISLAKAQADRAAATAEANGQTFTAQQRADLMRQSLEYAASFMKGPARDAVLAYADTLKSIPAEVRTKVTTTFSTSGDQRGRPGQAFAAGGTPDRGVAWVGEYGPEPVIFPGRGERVVSTSEARQTLREAATGGGGGEPIVVKLVLDGREIAEALVRRERGMR